jgi:hypothetical protein
LAAAVPTPRAVVAVAVLTLGVAGTAQGAPKGPQRAAIYGPEVEETGNTCAAGAGATPGTFGSVVLDTPGDETTVSGKVTVKHATPSATFEVTFVEREPMGVNCSSFLVGTLKTSKRGSAKFRFLAARASALGASTYWVTLAEESPFTELLASSAVELD